MPAEQACVWLGGRTEPGPLSFQRSPIKMYRTVPSLYSNGSTKVAWLLKVVSSPGPLLGCAAPCITSQAFQI